MIRRYLCICQAKLFLTWVTWRLNIITFHYVEIFKINAKSKSKVINKFVVNGIKWQI